MTRTLLALIFAYTVFGADITVCASGCGQTSLQAALDAASSGDTITLTAGEVFTTNNFVAGKNLWIRTSEWRSLPPPGVRMTEADRAKMPRLTPTSTDNYTLFFGYAPIFTTQNGVNTTTDVITWAGATNSRLDFAEGMEVMCGVSVDGHAGVMPSPLNNSTKYFIKSWSSGPRTSQLSLTPGGAAIDITTAGSAGSADSYGRPSCAPSALPTVITVTGLHVYDGGGSTPLVSIGGKALPTHALGPRVIIDRCFIEGTDGVISARRFDRPLNGVFINDGTGSEIRDSVIRRIYGSDDSQAIGVDNASKVRIVNNYLDGALTTLFGGGDNNGAINNRDAVVTGNFFDKPGERHWRSGHGAPTGACYYGGSPASGAFYLNLDVTQACASNACYVCGSDGTWAVQTGATIRTTSNQSKNHFEIKDLVGGLIEGNVFQGQEQDFNGQGWTYGISVITTDSTGTPGAGGPWTRGHNILFRNNHAHRNWAGVYIRNSKYGTSPFSDVPMRNIGFVNNLQTNLGEFPALCRSTGSIDCLVNLGTTPAAWMPSSAGSGITKVHNTVRGAPKFSVTYNVSTAYSPNTLQWVSKDNLEQVAATSPWTNDDLEPIRVDNGAANCSDANWTVYGNTLFFTSDVYYTSATLWGVNLTHASCSSVASNNVKASTDPLFTGTPSLLTPNSALQVTSVYSDQYADATHLASDGSSMGIDEKRMTQWTVPAVNGVRNMREQLSLNVTRVGTTLQFNFNARGQSCTVSVYSAVARTVANRLATTTDTDGAFTFTGISANPSWYHVDCASSLGLYWVDTI